MKNRFVPLLRLAVAMAALLAASAQAHHFIGDNLGLTSQCNASGVGAAVEINDAGSAAIACSIPVGDFPGCYYWLLLGFDKNDASVSPAAYRGAPDCEDALPECPSDRPNIVANNPFSPCQSACTPPQTEDADGNCVCPPGRAQTLDGTGCHPDLQCPSGQVSDGAANPRCVLDCRANLDDNAPNPNAILVSIFPPVPGLAQTVILLDSPIVASPTRSYACRCPDSGFIRRGAGGNLECASGCAQHRNVDEPGDESLKACLPDDDVAGCYGSGYLSARNAQLRIGTASAGDGALLCDARNYDLANERQADFCIMSSLDPSLATIARDGEIYPRCGVVFPEGSIPPSTFGTSFGSQVSPRIAKVFGVCADGKEEVAGPGCRACAAGSFSSGGAACRSCPAGAPSNAARTACECAVSGEVFDSAAARCVCDAAQNLVRSGAECAAGAAVAFTRTDGAGGTLRAEANGLDFTSGGLVPLNSTVTFVAEPAADHFVSGWSGGCESVGVAGFADVPGAHSFCMLRVAEAATVGAAFTRVWPVAVSPDGASGGGGSFKILSRDRRGERVLDPGATVADDSEITIRADADGGYFLREWSGDCEGMPAGEPAEPGAEADCVLTADRALSAGGIFARSWRVLYPHRPPNGTVSARTDHDKSPPELRPGARVEEGATVVFTAEPFANFYVSGWSHPRCGEAENLGVETETGPAHRRECELTAEADLVVTVTFSAGIVAPESPTNFQAFLISTGGRTTVTLAWDEPTPANGRSEVSLYRFWSSSAAPSAPADCAAAAFPDYAGAALESAGVSGLAQGDDSAFHDATESGYGRCFRFGLSAENAAGASPTVSSPAVYVQGIPDAATGLRATLLDGGAVSLSWRAPSVLRGAEIFGYEILRETNRSGVSVSIGFASGTAYVDSAAAGGTTLEYYVRLESGAGRGAASAGSGPVETSPFCAPAGEIPPESNCVCDEANFYVRFGAACAEGGRVILEVDDGVGGGVLSAQVAGLPVASGDLIPRGRAVVATARPRFGYYVLDWTAPLKNEGQECETGDNYDGREKTCAEIVNATELDFVVSFARQTRTVAYDWSHGGSVRASWAGDAEVSSGEAVPRGATLTLTALPARGYEVSLWSGACAAAASAASCALTMTIDFSASVSFADVDECSRADACAGANRICVNEPGGHACACDGGYGELSGVCVHETDALPEDRTTCEDIFGGEWVDLSAEHGEGSGVCSEVDINDTFCLAHSGSALRCLGLFNHVRSCNLVGRPALDPWHCGPACAGGKAAGARCLE